MPYQKLYKDITRYPSKEALVAALHNTKEFAQATREEKIQAIHEAESAYDFEVQARKDKEQEALDNAPDFTGRLNQAISRFVAGPEGSPMESVVNGLTNAFLPNSNAQAAIDAALLMAPEAESLRAVPYGIDLARLAAKPIGRLALRMGIPTVAGALGGGISGNMGSGAISGFSQAAGGEIIGSGLGLGKRTIHDLDFSRLRGWLEPRIKAKVPDIKAFRALFRGGEVTKPAEEYMAKATQKVQKMLKSKGFIDIPIPTELHKTLAARTDTYATPIADRFNVQVNKVDDFLNEIEKIGWDFKHDPAKSHIGAMARSNIHKAEGEVAQILDGIDKKASGIWYTARQKLRTARTLQNLFTEPGVLEHVGKDLKTGDVIENGRISFEKLQKLISDEGVDGYKLDIKQSMGESEQKSLSKMLHRGATEGEEDSPGRGFGSNPRLHLGFIPTFSPQMAWPARHVGDIPYDLGRGRMLTLGLTLGPYRTVRAIENLADKITGGAPSQLPETNIAPVAPVAPAQTGAPNNLPPTSIAPASGPTPLIHMDINKSPGEMAEMHKDNLN